MLKYILLAGTLAFSAAPALADPDKDESGKGSYREWYGGGRDWNGDDRWKGDDRWSGRDDRHRDRRRHSRRIPRGHLPPPGECRSWYPDLPAGHQPPPTSCRDAW